MLPAGHILAVPPQRGEARSLRDAALPPVIGIPPAPAAAPATARVRSLPAVRTAGPTAAVLPAPAAARPRPAVPTAEAVPLRPLPAAVLLIAAVLLRPLPAAVLPTAEALPTAAEATAVVPTQAEVIPVGADNNQKIK